MYHVIIWPPTLIDKQNHSLDQEYLDSREGYWMLRRRGNDYLTSTVLFC